MTAFERAEVVGDEGESFGFQGEAPIGAPEAARGFPFALVAAVYSRVLAFAWMLKGLAAWAGILGIGEVGFLGLPLGQQALLLVFAIGQPCVAVGLWMLSVWGRALWLIIALAEIAAPAVVPDMAFDLQRTILFLGLAALFWLLLWRERQGR